MVKRNETKGVKNLKGVILCGAMEVAKTNV